MSRAHNAEDDSKDDEQANMEHTSDQFNPGDQSEGEGVEQSLKDTHSNDQDRSVPATRDVVLMVQLDHGLEQDDGDVGDTRKQRDVTEPCSPTLDPGRKTLDALRSQVEGPVVLRTGDGLD